MDTPCNHPLLYSNHPTRKHATASAHVYLTLICSRFPRYLSMYLVLMKYSYKFMNPRQSSEE